MIDIETLPVTPMTHGQTKRLRALDKQGMARDADEYLAALEQIIFECSGLDVAAQDQLSNAQWTRLSERISKGDAVVRAGALDPTSVTSSKSTGEGSQKKARHGCKK